MLSWVVALGWFGFERDVLVYGLWMVGVLVSRVVAYFVGLVV